MRGALALARREVVRFLRQPSRVVGAVAPPLLAWLVIGSGFGRSLSLGPAAGAASSFLGYFFPGTVVLVVLFAAIFSTISVIEDRREGFLQGVLASPLPASSLVFGKVAGGTFLALAQGLLLFALVPFLGVPLRPADLALAAGVLTLLSLALTGLGFAIAWSLDSTQGFHSVMNLFLVPMWLLSGAFFPLDGAPAWLRAVMAANPLTYGVAALRRALDPASAAGLPSFALSLFVTAGFALATAALSSFVVARFPSGPGPGRDRTSGRERAAAPR